MITSFIDGRLRIRDEFLKDFSNTENLKESLGNIKGIVSVYINRRVGSMLVLYNGAVTGANDIMRTVSAHLTKSTGPVRIERRTNVSQRVVTRTSHLGMLVSLGTSLIAAVLGGKGLHIAAGVSFLLFLMIHFSQHKKRFFA